MGWRDWRVCLHRQRFVAGVRQQRLRVSGIGVVCVSGKYAIRWTAAVFPSRETEEGSSQRDPWSGSRVRGRLPGIPHAHPMGRSGIVHMGLKFIQVKDINSNASCYKGHAIAWDQTNF